MLTPDYIAYLENLPCNSAARQRAKPVGSWMAGWVPLRKEANFTEPMQQQFIESDASEGALAKIQKWKHP